MSNEKEPKEYETQPENTSEEPKSASPTDANEVDAQDSHSASSTPEAALTSDSEPQDVEHDNANEMLQEENVAPETESKAESAAEETDSKEETSAETIAASQEDDIHSSETHHNDDEGGEEDHHEEDDGLDYSSMSLEELVAQAQAIAANEHNLRKADRKMGQIREEVDRINNALREEQHSAFAAKANETTEEGQEEAEVAPFRYEQPREVEEFYALFKDVKERKQKHYENLTKEREDNLAKKRKIIAEIKQIIENTEQAGSLAKVKEFQKEWKQIGSVPKLDADDLYKTYNALLDLFYDNKSIEYDLKELDRKKNLELKLAICERAEALLESSNINDAVRSLNLLHEDFKGIGPVPREEQEAVWKRFKEASDELYNRKRQIAEEFKKELAENMQQKQQLCLEVEAFVNFDSDRIKEWNAKTKELLALQERWEKIGPLPREVAKDINKQFWGDFKNFFANKSRFFEKLEAQRTENLKLKQALVEQAEALKESKDWAETAQKLKELQQEWRKIGPVPESHRNTIYATFKAACDYFFNRKRNRRSEQDKEFEENLKKKKEVCKAIEALAKQEGATLEQLDEQLKLYNEIGFVPRKDINTILEKMIAAIDAFFDGLKGLEEEELEKKRVTYKGEVMKSVPNASKKLERQELAIRSKIQQKENDIALWQNNLQFFASSKTADKLRDEFQHKIEDAQKNIESLKEQLRILQSITDNS